MKINISPRRCEKSGWHVAYTPLGDERINGAAVKIFEKYDDVASMMCKVDTDN
jgi:hypothetical protein